MKNFEKIKEEKNSTVYFETFEKSLMKTDVIIYNKDFIEFPGMLIFTRGEKGIMYQMINPGVDLFSVEAEDFDNMLTALSNSMSTSVIEFDSKTSPISTVRVNLDRVRDTLVLYKESSDTVICNKTLFTTNEFEFQGSAMFSGRKNVFWISQELLEKIKDSMQ